jgi:hypothetical protein
LGQGCVSLTARAKDSVFVREFELGYKSGEEKL